MPGATSGVSRTRRGRAGSGARPPADLARLQHRRAERSARRPALAGDDALAPHQLLRIRLDESTDGGFSWETTVKPDPAVLTRRKTIRRAPTCTGQVCPVGGGDTVFFRYVGHAAGRTKLRLGEFGPGRPSKPSVSFRLTVRVR